MTRSKTAATAPTLIHDRQVHEIVFPVAVTDVHERGEGLVVNMAQRWSIPVRLVHVSDSIDPTDPELEAYATRLRKRYPTLEVHTKHVYGEDVATAVSSVVGPHSLVVMTTQHADEWKVKGSIAEAVLFSSGVPVMLFGPHAKELDLDGEVIVGLDGSLAAEAALGPAAGLAEALGARIWVVRVVDEPKEAAPRHPEVAAYAQEKAKSLGGPGDAGWEVIQNNDPVAALDSFAQSRGAGFIVAGARGRTNLSRRSMGSITMGLVSTSRRPVLAVVAPETPAIEKS